MRLLVVPGLVVPASIASEVAISISGAVNELLRRESVEGSVLEAVRTFDCLGGRESPARSAVSLILDGSHAITRAPVDRSVGYFSFDSLNVVLGHGHAVGAHHLAVLRARVVGEFVVAGGVSVLRSGGVHSSDEGVDLDPAGKAVSELFTSSIGLAPFRDPLHEFELVGGQ